MSRARSSADALAARLAKTSRVVAEEYRRRAPAATDALGDGVERWGELGAELLEGCRTGAGAALAYFRTAPLRIAPDDRERWVRAGLRIAAVSPALAASFCEVTAGLLGAVAAAPLDAFADETVGLRTHDGWRGERLAHLFVTAAPLGLARLDPGQFHAWHRLVVALASVLSESAAFRALPADVADWTGVERDDWLAWALPLAPRRPAAALAVYRDLPAALAAVAPPLRARLLGAVRASGATADPLAIEQLVPVVGALVQAVPAADRDGALALVEAVGAAFPAGVPGVLRSLARLYEEATAERVAEWGAHGLTLAAQRPDAALAFFGFESRTSRQVLQASPTAVALEDVQGVARRFVHMLSGRTIVLRGEGGLRLALALEEEGDGGGALPARIDCGPTAEDNARVYRTLAALLAARRLYGTYDDPDVLVRVREDERALLLRCFTLADGFRVGHRLGTCYPGLAAELRWTSRHLLGVWADATVVDVPFLCDGLLAASLAGDDASALPSWLAPAAAAALPLLRSLATPHSTVADAVLIADLLVALVPFPPAGETNTAELSEYARFMLDLGGGEDAYPLAGDDGLSTGGGPGEPDEDAPAPDRDAALQILVDELLDDAVAGGRPLDPDELARLLEAGLLNQLSQAAGLTPQQAGLYVTQLVGKLLGARPELPRAGRDGATPRKLARMAVDAATPVFVYDEWDHEIADYRPAWCRLREIPIADDAGVCFTRTLERHAALVPEIRRHFQRVLPETYRAVRGLEDGEEVDFNALVDARVQRRAGHSGSSKLYTARVRQEREVATLFLLDMSASTDESPPSGEGRRIIDIAKDALVLMAAALDEMGDSFAIYGFSGQGRDRVEVYPVKSFAERLSAGVKGRIGGIEPKGSTRMGTALRHALVKMRGLTAPSRHLILLSDGFPQDLDYGRDRHSHLYGIRDTAVALREVEAAGVKPFCITVDLAGHDYLREMCDPHRYLVIERLADLPRELPKIYQRLVRAA